MDDPPNNEKITILAPPLQLVGQVIIVSTHTYMHTYADR